MFSVSRSLILKEEHRLRVLRRILGYKWEAIIAGCRQLHNQKLHYLYTSPNIIIITKSMKIE
jgi:hypothetical protein